MQTKWKRMLACFLAMSMMVSAGSIVVNSEGDQDAAGDKPATSDGEETGESTVSEDFVARTEQQVLDSMIVAAENDKLIFYVWDYENATEENPIEDIFALKNKETGYIWWSSPYNAAGDPNATPTLRKELASALTINTGIREAGAPPMSVPEIPADAPIHTAASRTGSRWFTTSGRRALRSRWNIP